MNVLQRVGGSIGTAVLAVVLQRALAGGTGVDDAAAAFGTAFWWSVGITAAAIIPCIVLVRAERRARTAATTSETASLTLVDARRERSMTTTATRSRAPTRSPRLGNVVQARRTLAVRRLKGRETHRPGTRELRPERRSSSPSQSTTRSRAASSPPRPTSPPPPSLRCSTRSSSSGSSPAPARSTDRRVVTCSLTDEGREHIAERRAKFEGYWNEALSGFSAAELAVAAAVFDRIAAMFDGFDADRLSATSPAGAGTR